jgi:hypothetical protein
MCKKIEFGIYCKNAEYMLYMHGYLVFVIDTHQFMHTIPVQLSEMMIIIK